MIIDEMPDLLIMGGPTTYLQGFRIGEAFFQTAVHHMKKIVSEVRTVVIDHHLLRDEGWYKFLEPVRESAKRANNKLLLAADLLQQQPTPLDCRRKQPYEEESPARVFLSWTRLPMEDLDETQPPAQD